MTRRSRVVWSEGLFLRPQHFQQQERWSRGQLDGRLAPLGLSAWGFTDLAVNRELLALGRLAVIRARGVLPDGTPFDVPEDDPAPAPIDVPETATGARVFLALPITPAGAAAFTAGGDDLASHGIARVGVRDVTRGDGDPADVAVGPLRLQLMPETEDRSAFTALAVARVVDIRADGMVTLDDDFIPPAIDVGRSPRLAAFATEVAALLHHRGESLAARLGSVGGQSGVADVANFLLLQLVNRAEVLFDQLKGASGLHPQRLYEHLTALAGELATFTSDTRRPERFIPYRHDDPQACFSAAMRAIRLSLSAVLEQTAVPLELQTGKYGIRLSPIHDRSLVAGARFVLAVSAAMAPEQLRRQFPAQVKIGAVERIRTLINLQLPGARLTPLPVAPRQLPYHAGYTYFDVEQDPEYWADIRKSAAIAFHIAGDFPELQLEFWAIRRRGGGGE